MPPTADYLGPVATARGELREKGSRFLAVVAPAADEAAAQEVLAALAAEHPDATHHCFAWRLGPEPRERAGDAGEPAGTAGVPILQVLRGRGLSDVVAVVVRWYGGTKLGKGGLARAYAAAARLAADELPVERRVPRVELALALPYERLGAVKRLVHPPEVELVAERYGERVELVLSVRADRRDDLAAALADLGVAAASAAPRAPSPPPPAP
jgi:uncharacterized YigZ family protein